MLRLNEAEIRETIYRLDGPLRWALGENDALLAKVPVARGQHVLDVGAGTGYLSLPLAAAVDPNGSVRCVDLCEPLLDVLRQKAIKAGLSERIEYLLEPADHLSLPDDGIDAVFSSYLLHELADKAQAALKEMYRVLKPGGTVVLADYRRIEDVERRAEIEAWYGAQRDGGGTDEVHLRFSLADLERMLLEAGFRSIELAIWHEFHFHARAIK